MELIKKYNTIIDHLSKAAKKRRCWQKCGWCDIKFKKSDTKFVHKVTDGDTLFICDFCKNKYYD